VLVFSDLINDSPHYLKIYTLVFLDTIQRKNPQAERKARKYNW
jgi:hypothetical protein